MSTDPLTTSSPISFGNPHLFAAIDLGTNSFKLRIIRVDPTTHRFLTLHRLKQPATTTATAVDSLRQFQHILHSLHVPPAHLRLVATAAIRESPNQSQFLHLIHQTLGLQIDVVSGYDEARLTYLGVLQFLPYYNQTVLTLDIGGGSTEFVVGFQGNVKLGVSLKLGHVSLTQRFVKHNEINAMREYIRSVVNESGLIEKVSQYNIDIAVGSSGSIRMIEKAIFMGYSNDLVNEIGLLEGYRRDWKFNKQELKVLVEKICKEEKEGEEKEGEEVYNRKGFFKARSAFIVAAVILLEEIFGLLGVEEMEVSGYALGEGVIAEKLAECFDGFDLNANGRWRSVLRLASRFNNKKQMTSAASCASVAQEIFRGLRKWNKIDVLLDDKDLEYLEAACLLHNIGLVTGKKGYHKRSYHIIMNGEHLHGYNTEEVKLIALLVRHHRKKFPKLDHDSLGEFTEEGPMVLRLCKVANGWSKPVLFLIWGLKLQCDQTTGTIRMKHKFRVLCVIIRLSAILKQYQSLSMQSINMSHSHEGFKLVFKYSSANGVECIPADVDVELRKELERFEMVVEQKLSVAVLTSTSGS